MENNDSAFLFLEEENPYAYFYFLKYTKGNNELYIKIQKEVGKIPSREQVEFAVFKMYICELIYNAINFFPDVYEYTITCKNEQGTSTLCFAVFEDMCDDNHHCMAKLVTSDIEMYNLNLEEIKVLYMSNRHEGVDSFIVDTMVMLMCMGGNIPRVSTSYKLNENNNLPKLRKEYSFIRDSEPDVPQKVTPRPRQFVQGNGYRTV